MTFRVFILLLPFRTVWFDSVLGREEEAGRARAKDWWGTAVPKEIRLLQWRGVHSSEPCYSNWFSDQQDGHCLRVCRIQNLRPRSRRLESELTEGLCPLWKFQKLCSKADAVLGQSRSELRDASTGKILLDGHERWITTEALFQNLSQPIHLVCRAAAVT